MRYALKVFYLGKYEGFQRQSDKETIEGFLEAALQEVRLIKDFKTAEYMSAGRTDKGVHALGQVVGINTTEKLIIPAINTFLPKDIMVWAETQVNEKFHPRYDSLSRYYRYYTYYSEENLELMRQGAQIFEGIHNFKLFSKKNVNKSTIRQIFQVNVERKDQFLIFHVIANSFLWQMVRRMVDCLLKIGKQEWHLEDLHDLLDLTPKSNIFTRAAPANGIGSLILWDIEYPFKFNIDHKSVIKIKEILEDYLKEFVVKRKYFQEISEFFKSITKINEG